MSDIESPVPVREGLPPSYRMRAETHYVDLLETRSADARERAHVDPPTHAPAYESRAESTPAPRAQAPAVSHTDAVRTRESAPVQTDDPALHAGRDLAQSLSTLSACADLLNASPSDLSRAVVSNLIRAEAWRASTLLHGTRVLRQELLVARTAVSVLGVLDQVVQGFGPERKVRPVSIDSQSDLPHGSFLAGDERMLVAALTGALLATLPLLEGVPTPRILVSAAVDGHHQLTFAVSQEIVSAPHPWHSRAFDRLWTDRPGGTPALVSMLAVQETARAHGGSASVSVVGRGTKIGLTIPLGV